MKELTHDLNHNLTVVCHSISSMFRVLGQLGCITLTATQMIHQMIKELKNVDLTRAVILI